MEAGKGQEITALQALQNEVDETNALLLKEHEAAQKASEAHPIIIETLTPLQDAEKIENLNAEVANLKVMAMQPIHFRYSPIFTCWRF